MIHRALPAVLLALACAPRAAAALQISEFMADNADALTDEDGDYSDWVEIYNPDAAAVHLLGWRLTDSAAEPNKWVFPAVTIPAGGRLLVFASNKNRRDPARELHTNFQLSRNGEYLGLLRPDAAVEHAYAPAFPPQYEDVSYGYGVATSEQTLIQGYQQGVAAEPGAPCRWRVPASNANDILIGGQPNPNAANVWTGTAFNDAAWTAGSTGVGYDTNPGGVNYLPHLQSNCQTAMQNVRQSIYIRVPFTVLDAAGIIGLRLRMKYDDGFAVWLNGNPTVFASANAPAALDWNSAGTTTHDDAASIVYEDFPLPPAAVSSLISGANVLCIQGLNSGVGSSDALFTPMLIATTTSGAPLLGYMSTPTPGGFNIGADPNPGPLVRNVPKTLPPPAVPQFTGGAVADSATEFSGNQGQNGWSYGYWTGGGAYNHNTGFTPFTGGTTAGAWNGTTQQWTGSAWDKQTAGTAPWTFINVNSMHPNDPTPGPLDTAVVRWTSDVSGPHMVTGNFTRAATTGDGTTGRIFHNGTEVFSAVTAGTAQSFGVNVNLAAGDRLDFMVDAGPTGIDDGSDTTTYDIKINPGTVTPIALPITAEVLPTIHPVASVDLKWRVMFGAEQTLTMYDDGAHGDGAANDNVYGATISNVTLLPGQMIRWRVVATDTVAEMGKSPPFAPVDDSPEYWGTVAQDSRTATSQLPVISTFIQNAAGADGVGGTRCAVWFLNEFYDNVFINRHGQSTGGFVKKSYNLDFNRDNRFRYEAGTRRVKDIDLLTNWGDKSKVRNTLAWETMRVTGSRGHFAFPVRVERNGSFFAVVDMVEDGDDRYLERVGLDPEGALYKMYNTLDSATTGVEKKTRRWENNNDLQALINGLNPGTAIATRRLYGYDHVDIPILLNNLAALALINSQDQGHKNYYLYKDPGLQNDWKLLAWDMDLSFGHTWTGGQNYFDDDMDSQRDMRNGATNRLKQLLYDSPELNKAWMRRMRTLMDKYYVSALSTTGYFETRIAQVLNQIDPPGLPPNTSDAFLDFQRWGYWTDGNGGASVAWNSAGASNHTIRASAQRILNANPAGIYPQATPYSEFGRSSVPPFLPGRRAFLYNDPSRPAGSPNNMSGSEPLPAAQAAAPPVTIASVNYDPGTGDQEYLVIRNSSPTVAVDISDWTLSGAVEFTFPGGTVIPPGAGVTQHMGDLFVTRSPRDFRLRTASPKGGEYCYIAGPYTGRLSARGETVDLKDAAGTLIASNTWAPAPTAGQQQLRVSEIHYNPLNPSAAELAGNPSWGASDFEFIELQNTGAIPLDLSGARLDDAVTFTFPAATVLAPGARILVVANTAAFGMRYNTAGLNVAGQWTGNLDNGGEKLKVYDGRGEEILEFSYGDWYSPTDGDGYSLVFLNPAGTPYSDWGLRANWSISAGVGGTPGAADTSYSMGYDVWENTAFPTLTGDDNLRSADPDFDALINLVEYAVNSNPLQGTQTNWPAAGVVTAAGQSYYALTFRRWKHSVDILYTPEISGDAQSWTPLTVPHGPAADNGDGTETVTFRSSTPRSTTAREFVRLRVTER